LCPSGDRALNDPFERKEDSEDNPRQLALEIIIKQLCTSGLPKSKEVVMLCLKMTRMYLLRVTYSGIRLKATTPFAKHLM
jgi:hypothetical protein